MTNNTTTAQADQPDVNIAETIAQGRSDKGGWNKPQLALIGVTWPPIRGWRMALEASNIRVAREIHDRFVELRGWRDRPIPADQWVYQPSCRH